MYRFGVSVVEGMAAVTFPLKITAAFGRSFSPNQCILVPNANVVVVDHQDAQAPLVLVVFVVVHGALLGLT
jgi:hypothetical protein